MKLLGLGDNVMDAYLFRGELYPGGNAANVPNGPVQKKAVT